MSWLKLQGNNMLGAPLAVTLQLSSHVITVLSLAYALRARRYEINIS